MSKVEAFLSPQEESEVIGAIRQAELKTSGEIRVHLEAHAEGNVFDRAQEVFHFLHMDNTKNANGVLIYIAVEDRKLVIMGDKGINEVVEGNFWESTKDRILAQFSQGHIKQGLVEGILEAGKQLKQHFPYTLDDQDELPNEISTR
ncbi:TPM domain-containing protein [Aureisphaera galaxeae]|uniref:TPM domain-containing protein n=1 Tax=Aureisphaera galaxeae TaxID=1538023 RepID=UPI0023506A7C|nr:TPM domain-containing protein [Aureisphaera galaxeae]MDC8003123.1 TPM domain-containing protein [Aureisphaera galaxeae]